ncbi:MAG: hypothetical protein LBD06_04870, partial [Candidatus Accumulibacter sp.]|nr:hypothetical protein [Accumulibacter sp.]
GRLYAQAPFHPERYLQIRTTLAGKFLSPLTYFSWRKKLAFEHSCCLLKPLSSETASLDNIVRCIVVLQIRVAGKQ